MRVEEESALHPGNATLAALPLSAALTLLAARWLPISFEYQPNDLGIVSLATLERYPAQQEIFWYLFALIAGGLLTWSLARVFRRGDEPLGLEAGGATALLAALWLPPVVSTPICVAAAALLIRRASRGRSAAASIAPPSLERSPSGPLRTGLLVFASLALGMLLAPGVWANLWNVANDVPDDLLVVDHFKFLGESGQHLAWANAILRGGLQGRDVFCLYGPLFDLGVVGFWQLVGRSVAGWELYWSLNRVLGWSALLLLGAALLRRRSLVLLLPFLVPWVKLRIGLPLFALLGLLLWMRSGRLAWCVPAGLAAGTALVFSQEFGLALWLAAAPLLALRRDGRAALLFAAGALVVLAPILGYYAAEGALVPMLRDLVEYPRYLMAGFAKLPFPALAPALPLDPSALGTGPSRQLRVGYAAAAICAAGFLLALPVAAFDARRPLESLRRIAASLGRDPVRLCLVAIALFGLVAFRSALGRSQLSRTLVILPPVVLLLCFAADRLVDQWRSGSVPWRLVAWRAAALALLVLHAGLLEVAAPLSLLRRSGSDIATLIRRGNLPRGSEHVMRVTRWVRHATQDGEPVLFLPNDGAYYYLTDRPNPIRFVMGHQMVTSAHRAEALADLRRSPPRYVVWDHAALRIDGLSDEQVFGPELLGWIHSRYREARRIGAVEILQWNGPGEPREP